MPGILFPMKQEQVRCWRVSHLPTLVITYPEGNMGHRLICCTSCGKVYAVNVAKQLYIESDLDVHLAGARCLGCGDGLAHHWRYYPDHYIGTDGKLTSFQRPAAIPADSESIIEFFPEVFS